MYVDILTDEILDSPNSSSLWCLDQAGVYVRRFHVYVLVCACELLTWNAVWVQSPDGQGTSLTFPYLSRISKYSYVTLAHEKSRMYPYARLQHALVSGLTLVSVDEWMNVAGHGEERASDTRGACRVQAEEHDFLR